MHGVCGPPYQSSTPARRAVLVDRVAHRAEVAHVAVVPEPRRDAGVSSFSGWIEQYSVETTAQPPSAFIAR